MRARSFAPIYVVDRPCPENAPKNAQGISQFLTLLFSLALFLDPAQYSMSNICKIFEHFFLYTWYMKVSTYFRFNVYIIYYIYRICTTLFYLLHVCTVMYTHQMNVKFLAHILQRDVDLLLSYYNLVWVEEECVFVSFQFDCWTNAHRVV